MRAMTVTLAAALLAGLGGLILLRACLGDHWLRHPVTWLYLISVVYQGASAFAESFPSVAGWDQLRDGIAPSWTDDAALLCSAAMLALTVGYALAIPRQKESAGRLAWFPDWRLLTACCVPVAVLTYSGRGYGAGAPTLGAGASNATAIAATFFTTLVTVTAVAVVLRYGARWYLPALAGQTAVLLLAGERTPVLAGTVALSLVLAAAGITPRRAHIAAALVLTIAAVLVLSAGRAEHGRRAFHSDSGIAARAEALEPGNAQPGTPGLIAQAAARLDTDPFAGAILQARTMGDPRLPAGYVAESLQLTIPSALWPSKLSAGNGLNPAELEVAAYGLQPVNFLPGLPGLYAGFLSWPWLLALMAFLGLLASYGERWLFAARTAPRLVMLTGAVYAAFAFEAGLPQMLLALRASAVIASTVWALQWARSRRTLSSLDYDPVTG